LLAQNVNWRCTTRPAMSASSDRAGRPDRGPAGPRL